MPMTDYFKRVTGNFSLYSDAAGSPDVRFAVAHFGEDAELVVAAFWKERGGDFSIVPLFAFGAAPRRDLCTQKSLVAALQTVQFDLGSRTEQQWKACCEHHKVPWPKRLQGEAA
jgi:hypothetical protein